MSEIRAGTTSTTALVTTGDTTGNIVLTPDSGVLTVSATGALTIPVGTTAQRPASAVVGQIRYNTTTGSSELYSSGAWGPINQSATPTVTYLIVAGGASGAGDLGGGGGAGGVLTGGTGVLGNTPYTIIVGAGGAQTGTVRASNTYGNAGINSSALALTAIGGGGGGCYNDVTPAQNNGQSGGSGGGGSNNTSGGSGTAGQGFAGGSGLAASSYNAGGGGGAGGVGANAVVGNTGGGAGGIGVASAISGSSVYYGGGGGGSSYGNATGTAGGVGGNGGGGNGGFSGSFPFNGSAGSVNTGGGGGGGAYNVGGPQYGAAGGSGIVIISFANTYRTATASGTFTVANVGGNYIYTFTGSGTITF
jgi:hypothetical protein